MALADILRERASRRGRTAQVVCGALGALTVEALPLRELELLNRGADGSRAVFYAACRELQKAGEAMRQAGQVFTPDGVMQYVSNQEAAAAARTVWALSGVRPDTGDVDGDGETADAKGADSLNRDAGHSDKELDEAGGTGESTETGSTGKADGDAEENRPGKVQLPKDELSEIRSGFAREPAPPAERENQIEAVRLQAAQAQEAAGLSTQPEIVWNESGVQAEGPVLHQFFRSPKTAGEASSMRANFNFNPPNPALSGETKVFHAEPAGGFEGAPEFSQAAHEAVYEIQRGTGAELHETASPSFEVLHEIDPGSSGGQPEEPCKTEPEAVADERQASHETTLGLDKGLRELPYEITSEAALRMARLLLEGLRRAAAVR